MQTARTTLTITLCSLLLCIGNLAAAKTLYINYNEDIPPADLLAYDLCILSSDTATPLPKDRNPDQQFLGYLSVVEIAPDATYRDEALAAGVATEGRNTTWGSDLVDPASPAWRAFILEELAPAIVAKGYDGFFLDTAESVELLAEAQPEKKAHYYEGLEELVKALRTQYPKKTIVINRGFSALPSLYDTVDGLLVESFYRGYNYDEETFYAVDKEDTQWLLDHILPAQKAGVDIYITDFLPSSEKTLADKTITDIEQLGFVGLISEPDLMGGIVAPLARQPRHWITLYGAPPNNGLREFPEDTSTMVSFQLPLEYYGYEVEYLNPSITKEFPETKVQTAGILIDPSLELGKDLQEDFVNWLIAQKQADKKLIFVAALPDLLPHLNKKLSDALGLGGDLTNKPTDSVELVFENEELIGMEVPLVIQQKNILDIQAPADASVFLEIKGTQDNGSTIQSTPIFTASWGGVVLDPYFTRLNPEKNPMLIVDTFAFVRAVTGAPTFPAPDVTTLQGSRIYFSHIDGDGFLNFSEVKRGKRSGPVITSEIIDHFGLPITASIIESEISGDSTVYQEKEGENFEAMVRELFDHPLVEPCSHTYSHPFFWSHEDITSRNYDTQNVNIKDDYNYGTISFKREIVDSVNYVNTLIPEEKPSSHLILWSGNCRPPPQALRLARENDIININGGNTTITKRAPYQALISPKLIQWGGETQVYAAVQNENIYNNALNNGRFGGFINVLQTFDMTETPRRLKPVNVYYHFYSADRFDAFTALRRVMEWCAKQALHPIWASEYIHMVLGSQKTAIFSKGDDTFVITNQGTLQTLRIPQSMGYPDLQESQGVWGFNDYAGERYIHIAPDQRVTLKLSPTPPTLPYLERAEATVTTCAISSNKIDLSVRNPSTHEKPVILSGFTPGEEWEMDSENKKSTVNAQGELTLSARPGQSTLNFTRLQKTTP